MTDTQEIDRLRGKFQRKIDEIRQSLGMVWVILIILIFRIPEKSFIDYVLLFVAIGTIASTLTSSEKSFYVDSSALPPLSERCQEAARDPARKFEAIRIYREETGQGLREAKAAVEAFIAASQANV